MPSDSERPGVRLNRLVLVHGLLAFTIVGILLAWGALLSPPLKPLREALGIGELVGTRLYEGEFYIINPDEELALEYMGRIAHYYHALFAALLYGTLVALAIAFPRASSSWGHVLNLALIGSAMTIAGAIGYAYIFHEPEWHGLFIGGLAVLFTSGVLALVTSRPSSTLEKAAIVCGALLIVGGLIGGYIGSHYMDPSESLDFRKTVIKTRFNPEHGDENELWRAWTGHQHAMVATSMALTFIAALGLVDLRLGRLSSIAVKIIAPATAIMALASYSVWFFGKIAHLVITPAAVLLITSTTLLSFLAKPDGIATARGALVWAMRIVNIGIWIYVAIPGAIIAMSLDEPTPLINPAFRDPSWDWAEIAFNIGHWHILLLAWGIALLSIAAVGVSDAIGRLSPASIWMASLAFMVTGLGYLLYVLANGPGEFSHNPYNDIWVKVLVEPGLAAITLSIIIVYLGTVKTVAARRSISTM